MIKKQVENQFFVPHNILEDAEFKRLKIPTRLLYIYLCKLQNRLGYNFYRTIKNLIKDTGLKPTSIKNAKKELVEKKYIIVTKDNYPHNGFRAADKFIINGYKFKTIQKP